MNRLTATPIVNVIGPALDRVEATPSPLSRPE